MFANFKRSMCHIDHLKNSSKQLYIYMTSFSEQIYHYSSTSYFLRQPFKVIVNLPTEREWPFIWTKMTFIPRIHCANNGLNYFFIVFPWKRAWSLNSFQQTWIFFTPECELCQFAWHRPIDNVKSLQYLMMASTT